jgi:hypothetical protein
MSGNLSINKIIAVLVVAAISVGLYSQDRLTQKSDLGPQAATKATTQASSPPKPDDNITVERYKVDRISATSRMNGQYNLETNIRPYSQYYYKIVNRRIYPINIKYVVINNRDDCILVPYGGTYVDGLSEVSSVPDSLTIFQNVNLKTGVSLLINIPDHCGVPVYVNVGLDNENYKIGPTNF